MAEKLATVPTYTAPECPTAQQQSGSFIMKSIVELANNDQSLTSSERDLLLKSEREAERRMAIGEDEETATFAAQMKDFAEDIDYMARKHRPVLEKFFRDSYSVDGLRKACRQYLWKLLQGSVTGGNIIYILILAYLLVRECVRQYCARVMGDSLADYLICIVEEVAVEFVRNKVYPFIQSHRETITSWVTTCTRKPYWLIGVGVVTVTVGGWWYLSS